MAHRGVLVALALTLVLAGTVYAASGWFGPPRSCNPHDCREAAWWYRTAQPHHWRACLLQH